MQLIDALVSGVRGAENGVAFLYQRGTLTLVDYIAAFEDTVLVPQPVTGVPLDASGGAVVYVDRLVRVVVKSSTGLTVRDFVAGVNEASVECRSDSFTGTSYSGAPTAAAQPTTLAEILDRWVESAGTYDWEVMVNGSAATIQQAVANSGGIFFNVRSATYGATGDGVTDDTAAITAAEAAAAVSGGIVFFPPGTYRTTSEITRHANVSLLGAGASCTTISIDHATANTLVESAASTGTTVAGLTLAPLRVNSGNLYQQAAGSRTLFDGLVIGSSLWVGTGAPVDVRGYAVFNGCLFTSNAVNTAASLVQLTNASAKRASFFGCRFVCGAVTTVSGYAFVRCSVGSMSVNGCEFDASAATGGTLLCAKVSTGLTASFSGNRVLGGAGTTYMLHLTGAASAATDIAESGTTFVGTATLFVAGTAGNFAPGNLVLGSRVGRSESQSVSAAGSITVDPLNNEISYVIVMSNAVMTIDTLTVAPKGCRATIVLFNSSGGVSGNLSLDGANVYSNNATFTMANGKRRAWSLVSDGTAWVQAAPVSGDLD